MDQAMLEWKSQYACRRKQNRAVGTALQLDRSLLNKKGQDSDRCLCIAERLPGILMNARENRKGRNSIVWLKEPISQHYNAANDIEIKKGKNQLYHFFHVFFFY
jgi:hypothetical protein